VFHKKKYKMLIMYRKQITYNQIIKLHFFTVTMLYVRALIAN